MSDSLSEVTSAVKEVSVSLSASMPAASNVATLLASSVW